MIIHTYTVFRYHFAKYQAYDIYLAYSYDLKIRMLKTGYDPIVSMVSAGFIVFIHKI